MRLEGPRAEVGFLVVGSEPPPHQLERLGSVVSSPSGVRGGDPENVDFEHFGTSEITSELSTSF